MQYDVTQDHATRPGSTGNGHHQDSAVATPAADGDAWDDAWGATFDTCTAAQQATFVFAALELAQAAAREGHRFQPVSSKPVG